MDQVALARYIAGSFVDLANPEKAGPMAAYLKTDMPFYGIQKDKRVPIFREMKKRFAPASHSEYVAGVLALWTLPHREEKYAAIEYALQHRIYIERRSLVLYERLIREGAWWDLVDGVAINLVGGVYLTDRSRVKSKMENWIGDEDFWIRRTAILSHLKHKSETDQDQLFDFCLRCAHETEFFIRKAIGWALREYSKTAPEPVREFLLLNRDRLSGLSFREGTKHLVRKGFMAV